MKINGKNVQQAESDDEINEKKNILLRIYFRWHLSVRNEFYSQIIFFLQNKKKNEMRIDWCQSTRIVPTMYTSRINQIS